MDILWVAPAFAVPPIVSTICILIVVVAIFDHK